MKLRFPLLFGLLVAAALTILSRPGLTTRRGVFMGPPVSQWTASAAFEEGVTAYRAGDLESAEAQFQKLLDAGLEPHDRAIVLYALGNIAFRSEAFLEAVACYTAASQAEPPSPDLWHNLELARARAGLDPADGGNLMATLAHLAALPPEASLWSAAWGLVGLFALVLLVEILRGGWLPKATAVVLALLLACDLALIQHRASSVLERPAMIITPGGASLCSEPNAERTLGITLEPGETVEVLDTLGTKGQPGAWIKVDAAEGTGWLDESEVFSW
jgi:tetratricopeptide (TPR) repeat protein